MSDKNGKFLRIPSFEKMVLSQFFDQFVFILYFKFQLTFRDMLFALLTYSIILQGFVSNDISGVVSEDPPIMKTSGT